MGPKKGENAMEEIFDVVEIFGHAALFGNFRTDHDTVPEGWFCYDLRGSDENPKMPATLEPYVVVNHAGTILSPESIWIDKEKGFREFGGELEFLGEETTLAEFCKDCGFEVPQVQQTDPPRPASSDEAGPFYALTQEKQETQAAQMAQETQQVQKSENTMEMEGM